MFSDLNRCKIITVMHAILTAWSRWTRDQEGYIPIHAIKWVRDDQAVLELPKDHCNIPAGQCWHPSDPGWVKINTDGAINLQAQMGNRGRVARSHLSFMGAWSKP